MRRVPSNKFTTCLYTYYRLLCRYCTKDHNKKEHLLCSKYLTKQSKANTVWLALKNMDPSAVWCSGLAQRSSSVATSAVWCIGLAQGSSSVSPRRAASLVHSKHSIFAPERQSSDLTIVWFDFSIFLFSSSSGAAGERGAISSPHWTYKSNRPRGWESGFARIR